MVGVNIIVNKFKFCLAHGTELCLRCCCDHRLGNNTLIDLEAFDRPSINVYLIGAAPASTGQDVVEPEDEPYKCRNHGEIDCPSCFAWAKIIATLK
ncbi:hypothetical protein CROQUDRAFT_107975 [Cronartium quercuum f. sp. fusiforme G11]|uniref:Uncharacterized protein n=1 Tax=Cronartium quercuum f. sp. fusiforme G11 TaxID=708437 RepID=A0A9P6TB01_9BASI|nr:hypothetical protein CROQUDRAFT_107975 [Cronartium quercuum f. sp. fusiforme G11]